MAITVVSSGMPRTHEPCILGPSCLGQSGFIGCAKTCSLHVFFLGGGWGGGGVRSSFHLQIYDDTKIRHSGIQASHMLPRQEGMRGLKEAGAWGATIFHVQDI